MIYLRLIEYECYVCTDARKNIQKKICIFSSKFIFGFYKKVGIIDNAEYFLTKKSFSEKCLSIKSTIVIVDVFYMENIILIPFLSKRIFPGAYEFLTKLVFSEKYIYHSGIINIFWKNPIGFIQILLFLRKIFPIFLFFA